MDRKTSFYPLFETYSYDASVVYNIFLGYYGDFPRPVYNLWINKILEWFIIKNMKDLVSTMQLYSLS